MTSRWFTAERRNEKKNSSFFLFQSFTGGMSQLNSQSDSSRGLRDEDVTPIQEEEQESKIYMPNKCDASLLSEEDSLTQVICSLWSKKVSSR